MKVPFEFTIPQCTSESMSGRRCEKADIHRRVEWQPLHKAGPITWSKGRNDLADPIKILLDEKGDLGVKIEGPADHLARWWREKAETEIEQTVDKAVEYGSTDLIDIGRSIARVANLEVEDDEAAEIGIFFYLEGKLSRWRAAIERGDRPSDDTLLDIGIYSRMAQRIRSHGGWPGVENSGERADRMEGQTSSSIIFDEASSFPVSGTFSSEAPRTMPKIAEVNWNGLDITRFINRKSDGTLDISFESTAQAARRAHGAPEQASGPRGILNTCPLSVDPHLPADACTCKPKESKA